MRFCPIFDHVCADEPWKCVSCDEHGCDLCEPKDYRDEDGERVCEGCRHEPKGARP